MSKVSNGFARHKKHKKILKQAKGYKGTASTRFKDAKQAVMKAMAYSTRDRKQRMRKTRELWIIRINAAARNCGLSYSKFMFGLKKSNVEIDRKILASFAYSDEAAFKQLVQVAKKGLQS